MDFSFSPRPAVGSGGSGVDATSTVRGCRHAAPHLLLTPDTTSGTHAGPYGPEDLEYLHHTAVRAAVAAAELIATLRSEATGAEKQGEAGGASGLTYGRVPVAETKSSSVDPVTQVDQSAERQIRQNLAQATPGARMLGEEDGQTVLSPDPECAAQGERAEDVGWAEVEWVVDPIDGTVNFIYGIPAYAVSVAAAVNGVPVVGAVAHVPAQRVYSARVGARANAQDMASISTHGPEHAPATAIGVGSPAGPADPLSRALVATGFSYLSQRRRAQAELATAVLPAVRDFRRIGSAALDLCLVASGGVDAYYEHGLGSWDHAAGAIIAARAGAQVWIPELTIGSDRGMLVMAAIDKVAERLRGVLLENGAGGELEPQ
ncbi:inositol monophosphatase family protein [Corynebacterium heidelbergense]|uniref:inositol-phosphate phosphatase n=1 Tax=Corynebacterium heidelbergense TaxID=2055947 RepID=A0A364VCL6_9CORY|nr:inositol monophosphatase family protein [Corynebacterium heidelbergense]RAV34395.1 inositol monophosphatase [Corynebacterium heidelbergense]